MSPTGLHGRRHGTRSCYLAGCRRPECAAAHRRYMKRYTLRADEAGGKLLVPIEPIREHFNQLRTVMSLSAIAKASGVSTHILIYIDRNKRGMRPDTAERILAVTPTTPVGKCLVHSAGTVRRVQALNAIGYTIDEIAQAAGLSNAMVRLLMRHGSSSRGRQTTRCMSLTAVKVKAAYDRMSMQPARGAYSGRVRKMAVKKGYVPPLAWDDDTIDDPNTRPVGAGYVEPTPVEQVLTLTALGYTRQEIADARGVTKEAVRRMLARAEKRGAA